MASSEENQPIKWKSQGMDTLYMGDKEQDIENMQGLWAQVIKQMTKSLTKMEIHLPTNQLIKIDLAKPRYLSWLELLYLA